MSSIDASLAAELLAAELKAALPARKAALEFERKYANPDQADRINRGLFEIRINEARLKSAGKDTKVGAPVLGAVALAEAESLEAEAADLGPLLSTEAAGRRIGLLRLVCALLHLAQLGEGRARAYFTLARQGRVLPEFFNEALELTPENELFFLALRRFEALLSAGSPWTIPDADWLRLRAATAPGRLRLRAATLRSGAEDAAGLALPPELAEKRRPYLDRGFESASALGWAVTGFTPKEAFAWGEEGIGEASQAQAWRDRGFDPEEAGAWTAAELLPDEAAAFKACGALDPATARSLRQKVGDVEHLLAWHRAGFAVAEVLRLRGSGVRSVEEALTLRDARPPQAPAAERSVTFGRVVQSGGKPFQAESAPKQDKTAAPVASSAPTTPTAPGKPAPLPVDPELWAQQRAWRSLGVKADDQASALAAVPTQGGAWMGWGVYEPHEPGSAEGGMHAYTLALAGGLMDVVAESEGVALPSRHYEPPLFAPPSAWQERLDRLRYNRGKEPLPGHWHVFAWPETRAWLFWGLISKTIAVPWGEAIDFDSHETWRQRWERKAKEAGKKDLSCPCDVGRTLQGGWWVGPVPSVTGDAGALPLAFDPKAVDPSWTRVMESFCLVMGMRHREPQWHLVAGREMA